MDEETQRAIEWRLSQEKAQHFSTQEVYRAALQIILSLPKTKTGLGLEEAKRIAQRALDIV